MSTMETGKTSRWRATVSTPGQMVDATRASTLTIRRMATGYASGPMEGNMKADGRIGSNMVSEFTHLPLERLREENGKRER